MFFAQEKIDIHYVLPTNFLSKEQYVSCTLQIFWWGFYRLENNPIIISPIYAKQLSPTVVFFAQKQTDWLENRFMKIRLSRAQAKIHGIVFLDFSKAGAMIWAKYK